MIGTKEILLMAISLVLGGFIGFLTSYFFYKKGKVMESDMIASRYYEEEAFIRKEFPDLFPPSEKFFQRYQPFPKQRDMPFIEQLRCVTEKVSVGGALEVLFRPADAGRNLRMSESMITNSLNQYSVPAIHKGWGWYFCKTPIPKDAPPGQQKLVFTLKDSKKNTNVVEFCYEILE